MQKIVHVGTSITTMSEGIQFIPFQTITIHNNSPTSDDNGCAYFHGELTGLLHLARIAETLEAIFPSLPLRRTGWVAQESTLSAASRIFNAAAARPGSRVATKSIELNIELSFAGPMARVHPVFDGLLPDDVAVAKGARLEVLPQNVFLTASLVLDAMIAEAEAAEVFYLRPQQAHALLAVAMFGNNMAEAIDGAKISRAVTSRYDKLKEHPDVRRRAAGRVTEVAADDWLAVCDLESKKHDGGGEFDHDAGAVERRKREIRESNSQRVR